MQRKPLGNEPWRDVPRTLLRQDVPRTPLGTPQEVPRAPLGKGAQEVPRTFLGNEPQEVPKNTSEKRTKGSSKNTFLGNEPQEVPRTLLGNEPSFIAELYFQIEFSRNIFPTYFLINISYLCFQNNKKSEFS